MLYRVRALVLGIVLLLISLALMATQQTEFSPEDMRGYQVRSWATQASLWLGVILVGVFFVGLVLEDRDRSRGYAASYDADPDDADLDDVEDFDDDGDLRP